MHVTRHHSHRSHVREYIIIYFGCCGMPTKAMIPFVLRIRIRLTCQPTVLRQLCWILHWKRFASFTGKLQFKYSIPVKWKHWSDYDFRPHQHTTLIHSLALLHSVFDFACNAVHESKPTHCKCKQKWSSEKKSRANVNRAPTVAQNQTCHLNRGPIQTDGIMWTQ